MALKTLTFLLAAGGAAYALYRLGQPPASEADAGGASAALGESADELAAANMSLPNSLPTPNEGERLQEMKLVNVGIGSAGDTSEEDLLAPRRGDAQQTESIKPGLPDFARGA